MALTATHVYTDRNLIVYRVVNVATLGTALTIPSAGGATPDLVTDAANNTYGGAASAALRKVVRAGLDGIGAVAAGALTQADARALLLGDGELTGSDGRTTPTALLRREVRADAGGSDIAIDVDVDGSGNPEINITCAAAAFTMYLYVELKHTLDR